MSTAGLRDPLNIAFIVLAAFAIVVTVYSLLVGKSLLLLILLGAAMIAFAGFNVGMLYGRRRRRA